MLPFAHFDEDLVLDCIAEFSATSDRPGPYAVTCLDQSGDFPTERMAFRLSCDDHPELVLKLDSAPATQRLSKDFQILKELQAGSLQNPRLAVIKPLYLSPKGHFHITEFAPGKTAKQKIYADPPQSRAGQIFRRGGKWLHELHASKPIEKGGIWASWMLEEVEKQRTTAACQACSETLEEYVGIMQTDLSLFSSREDTLVFSHGDFHGGNLILAQGKTFGLDFTEATRKLAVYDIVDYLKMDVFAPATAGMVGADGIQKHTRAMFEKGYRHGFDAKLLSYCLRGRLLIEWVKISIQKFEQSSFQRKKFSCLQNRLHFAFAQPLHR
ncbi:aminoglycoside phosphotransferase family protein [Pseudophaeobacter sp.]|uniref:phosphotransferase family protein n=1 Tax=Pseudophaeobacter sp. TaxID=1971739 RepID=UPI0032993772